VIVSRGLALEDRASQDDVGDERDRLAAVADLEACHGIRLPSYRKYRQCGGGREWGRPGYVERLRTAADPTGIEEAD
jgi:hypothetical protein